MRAAEEFPEPWYPISRDEQARRPFADVAAELEAEALAEIGPGHQLFGLGLSAAARCERCDKAIFAVSDGTWAMVHLTWNLHPEPSKWPSSARFASLAELLQQDADDPHH